ncbi:MAG: aminoacyl-tRNA hydrolase [Lachnospiraceae bacterium]|nr:aminoacyl-tRNA hydrolase [Lachnospiraceae bacterium]
MKMIVGLGNPDKKYIGTRHNTGFTVLDRISEDYQIPVRERKYRAMFGSGYIGGQKVLLVKPQTYMNLSGEAVQGFCAFYKIAPEDVLVIFDDVSLDVGQLRIRKKGSAGGHNGIKSIIGCIGSQDFPRIKVGVGHKPKEWDLADYVLGHISAEEEPLMKEAAKQASEAVLVILTEGIEEAMNRFNAKKEKKEKKPKEKPENGTEKTADEDVPDTALTAGGIPEDPGTTA